MGKKGGGGGGSAPDYTAMAEASKYAADVAERLGNRQFDEAKRQYDQDYATAKPIVDAQTGLMTQAKAQGDEYYNYQKGTFWPLEKQMVGYAQNETSDARLEEMAAQAAGDARRGQTQQANMMARQGLRYGYSPGRMGAMAASMAGANASQVAGAMTGARNNQRNVGWARQMDAAGLGRGLSGASLGAYGLSNNSGNGALANQMAPGSKFLGGMAQGAGIHQLGLGQQITGLNGILNAQASQYASDSRDDGGGGLFGSILGAGAQLGSAWLMKPSDRRLKKDIVMVGKAGSGINVYEFNYIDDDNHRYRGVMADEVEKVIPEAVVYGDDGYARVNYDMLGIQMVEV